MGNVDEESLGSCLMVIVGYGVGDAGGSDGGKVCGVGVGGSNGVQCSAGRTGGGNVDEVCEYWE